MESSNVNDIKLFVFGSNPSDDVMKRWRQGFEFFPSPSAAGLMQHSGGPCAVLAPVQAYIIDYLISTLGSEWHTPSPMLQEQALVWAMATIIDQAAEAGEGKLVLYIEGGDFPHESLDEFHTNLTECEVASRQELDALLACVLNHYSSLNGVILFLYSVIKSKGLAKLQVEARESEESSEPLVNDLGHASQAVLNLLLHGHGVVNAFDGQMNAGGLVLQGVPCQSRCGLLSVLEALNYMQVGSLLKNPRRPIWVIGSETHYTVLFSEDTSLTAPEPRPSRAKRLFKKYDKEDNGFVETSQMQTLLEEWAALGCCDRIDTRAPAARQQEQIRELLNELDAEHLGVVVMTDFLNKAAPADVNATTARVPSEFVLWHFNANLFSVLPNQMPKFHRGLAIYTGTGERGGHDLLSILRTKWRGLEVTWDSGTEPPIN